MFVGYDFVAASSQSVDSRVEDLANHSMKIFEPFTPLKSGGWESARFCEWPQEVILRLEART